MATTHATTKSMAQDYKELQTEALRWGNICNAVSLIFLLLFAVAFSIVLNRANDQPGLLCIPISLGVIALWIKSTSHRFFTTSEICGIQVTLYSRLD